ncbi:desmoplakin isoform X1 [Pimephales promelas]|uniref:desmoplakin isoform X1 n=1 Tax=Pimephales promelas TaxID=90988 RepID=UPI001955C9C5|nr:desmoplakin isoform X1 [Pimephales promelas]KAG1926657.1 desmoplakin [Pimephales promelas]
MSLSGSQPRLQQMSRRSNSRPDLTAMGYSLPRGEGLFMSGNGYQSEFNDGGYAQQTFTHSFSKSSQGGGGGGGGGTLSMSSMAAQKKAQMHHQDCIGYLKRAQSLLENMAPAAEVDWNLRAAEETMEQMKMCALELQNNRVSSDSILRSLDECVLYHTDIRNSITGTTLLRRTGAANGGWDDPTKSFRDDPSKSFQDALAWVNQNKRLIETAPFGEDSETIDQQILNHNKFHSSIQRSLEVDRARDELLQSGEKAALHTLDQAWDSLQKMSHQRVCHLRELQGIIEEISGAIMWVNDREEEELVFDWGDKNIDTYIPRKQESYSKLMSDLEEKEKELNKLKTKVDNLLKNQHPASDKIQAYMDTLQTQWSWLLQITKCIDVHLKENAAYSQFFREATEVNTRLQKDHEVIRKKFPCDKTTPLETLTEMLKNLEKEKERMIESKRQVQTLVSKSKNIVCLKPRYPEEKSSAPVMVKALCDFKQDQKGILKNNEGILKDNTQRSKWHVTGPGGLEMLIPSVCLIIPPPNPLSISLAQKNEQYYEAIMSIWSQLFINIKSLISWQYCIKDFQHINSLTLSMLSQMRPEEYRNIIKSLEIHYQEFMRHSLGSEMFGDEDKRKMEQDYAGAQSRYDQLVIQLPNYRDNGGKVQTDGKIVVTNGNTVTSESLMTVGKTGTTGKTVVTTGKTVISGLNVSLMSDLSALRRRLEGAEAGLIQHIHVPLKDNGVQQCSQRLVLLKGVHHDLDTIQDEYLHLRERILRELEGSTNQEQTRYLRSELDIINQKLGSLQGFSGAYIQRLTALQALIQSLLQAEDVIKVHEARLTEKETSSLDLNELDRYRMTLKSMKADLEQKKGVLKTMESELAKAVHWNGQIDKSFHQCDVDLSRYSEQVGQMTDRWRRIVAQIDSRVWDLDKQEKQLNHYKQSSSIINKWIQETSRRQDAHQITKFSSLESLIKHLEQQKALYSEIKGKKEKVDDVVKDSDICAASIKDYELQLASYSAGLETLLNIPIKKTMLQSPTNELRQEATELQSHYIELLTRSSDYCKYLGEMQNNMEDLMRCKTEIGIMEENLRRHKENLDDQTRKNKTLEDSLTHYRLELTQSKEQLISLEEGKRTQARQCSVTQESLDSTQNQLKGIQDEMSRLKFLIEEEKRKRRLAEERYTTQQDEYELAIRKRQKELDELSMSKSQFERAIKDKEREIERLRLQLEDEASRRTAAESETSKVRSQLSQEINSLKQTYESEIHVTKTTVLKTAQQKDEESASLRIQMERLASEKRDLEDELRKVKLSFSNVEAARRKAEEDALQQRASVSEESRSKRELETQIQLVLHQREEIETRHRVELAEANRLAQERAREITLLTQNLQDETRRRKAMEVENHSIRQSQAELLAKQTSTTEVINKLKISEQEFLVVKRELEVQKNEKSKLEQNANRLQSRIGELQSKVNELQAELEKEKRNSQDDLTKRKRMETELERVNQMCREYTTTITTLQVHKEQESASGRKYELELRSSKEELERIRKEHKINLESLARVNAELKPLQQQLVREQALVREANQRNDSLYKTIEEKSRALNESTIEIEKLQSLTQNLTKERLRLEEELRSVRLERDDVKRSLSTIDVESASRLSAIQFQLQTSNNRALELQELINELTKERESLRVEIARIQKQFSETSMVIQRSEANYKEIVQERDSLLIKLKLSQQDKDKQQRYEEELRRIKLSLESETKQKQRLQDEIDRLTKDFKYWKSQYELKDGQIRQSELDKDKVERDRASFLSEIQRLTAELRSVEERYKNRLQTSDKEILELSRRKETLEIELRRLQQRPLASSKNTQTDEITKPSCKEFTVQGLRGEVSLTDLVNSNLLDQTDLDKINQGKLTGEDIEYRLRSYLGGSSCIAGIFDEAKNRVIPFYQAMKEGLIRRGTTLELLEAQAASGFIIDPVNNVCMTVEEAWRRALVGKEFKDKLLSAEKAVTGYKDPATGNIISLFQAIEKELIEKGHGIRLLEAQIASGGIIDPKGSHRIDVEVAYRKGYFDREMNEILSYDGDDTKGFFDPNTHENLTYLDLKKRCITDPKTGLILLPLKDKQKPKQATSQKNTLRKRRVVIVDPDTGKEMTVREAFHRELIDYDTFLELSEQECEWEEITIETSEGTRRLLVDRKTGNQYDIQESLERGIIDRQTLEKYRAGTVTLTEFASLITSKSSSSELAICSSSPDDIATCSSPTQISPSSPTVRKRFASVSITLSPPSDIFDDQSPVGAIFDSETLEKITISEAQRRGILDNLTAQRLLEAQVCTGGIVNPATGQRLSLNDADKQSIIDEDMAVKLKPAQKAYAGFEDVKTKRRLSAAEAMKEKWLPYEAGQRFLEFQYLTGGLIDPVNGHRLSIEESIRRGWLDGRGAQKLQDTRNYIKNLTCPKTKLKISYKEAMDNCMVEENNGMKMLQATSMSTKGISSPYNVSSGPGSRTGSRTGSRSGSRRGSVDYTSSVSYSFTSS